MIFDAALAINCHQDRKWRKENVISGLYKGIFFKKSSTGVYEAPELNPDQVEAALADPAIVVTLHGPVPALPTASG